MCIAIPAKILSIKDGMAEADFGQLRREVSMELLPQAKTGDYVLVHAGFAITLLSKEEAARTLATFKEVFG